MIILNATKLPKGFNVLLSIRTKLVEMYTKQYGRFFNHHHVTTIGILIVLTVLITCCDACTRRTPSRRTPPPTPPKKPETAAPPKRTTVNPTFNPSGSAPSSPSGSAPSFPSGSPSSSPSGSATSSPSESSPSSPSGSPSSSPSGTSQPGENDNFCFSTIENITNEIIATKLKELAASGTLSNLSIKKQNVFLKWIKSNDTGCSNIQGYMIEIALGTGNKYHYVIKQLNQSSAKKRCDRARNCWPFSAVFNLTTEPNTTEASSIQTKGNTPKQPTKGTSIEQGEGTIAAGKSDNDGVSSTTIVVPVILVVMLVIVVIILVFWFKRRSTRKGYKDDQTQNSGDHVVGPVNSDVYTVVNPSAEKKKNGKSDNNDLVYTELSHMKSGKSVNEHPESDQTEYADITHILRAGETAYENGTPQNEEEEAYANVVALQ